MLSQILKIVTDATGAQKTIAGLGDATKNIFKDASNEITKRWANLFTGAAAIRGLERMAEAVVETVDQIKDLADQLDLSTEEVQKLQVASERAAVKINTVGMALRAIEELRTAAQTGDKRAVGIFQALGIDPSKGSALDILQSAMQSASGDINKQAALFDLVGKKAEMLRKVTIEMQNLGPIRIIDDQSLDSIDKANNAFKDLKREMTAAAAEPAGYWARVIARGNKIEREDAAKQRSGFFNFAFTRAIWAETFGNIDEGIDGSALPLPLKKPKIKPQPAAVPALALATQADAFSRIGLFVGGRGTGSSEMVRIGNYQLTTLRQIKSILEEANR